MIETLAAKVALYALLASVVGGSIWWVKHRVDMSYAQETQIETLSGELQHAADARERTRITAEANKHAAEQASKAVHEAEQRAAERSSVFTRRGEGRFERLLQAKPGLVVPRANRATGRVWRALACVAGADRPGACDMPDAASDPTD